MKYEIEVVIVCDTEDEYADVFESVSHSVNIIAKKVNAKESQMLIREVKTYGTK